MEITRALSKLAKFKSGQSSILRVTHFNKFKSITIKIISHNSNIQGQRQLLSANILTLTIMKLEQRCLKRAVSIPKSEL